MKEWLRTHASRKGSLDGTLAYSHETFHNAAAYALKNALYQKAITLMHNHNDVIPVRHHQEEGEKGSTNKKTVAYLQIGGNTSNAFVQALSTRLACNTFFLSKDGNVLTDGATSTLADADTIIVGIFDINKTVHIEQKGISYERGISKPVQDYVNSLCRTDKKVIVVLFGIPYSAALFPGTSATIIAYEDDPSAQRAAADVVLGNQKAEGILPVEIR
jgi:hypothetical protein